MSLDDLKEVVAAFNRSMAEALAFVEERKPGMVTLLEKSVKEQLEKLQVRKPGGREDGSQGQGQGARGRAGLQMTLQAGVTVVGCCIAQYHCVAHCVTLPVTPAAVNVMAPHLPSHLPLSHSWRYTDCLPQEVISDLRSGKYDNPQAASEQVLELLTAANAQYEVVAEKARRYKGYEELLGQTVTNFSDVDQVSVFVGR